MRERRRVPAKLRNVSFPVAVRGYERRAVESYVAQVNRVIAELEATHSPEAAIRHALQQADEQTRGALEKARRRAQEITAVARQKADEITARAKAEAADIVVNASTQADRTRFDADDYAAKVKAEADEHVANARAEAGEILAASRTEADERLQRSQEEIAAVRQKAEVWADQFLADTEAIWNERRELLDDLRELAARLATAASTAAARRPPGEPAERGDVGNTRTK